VTAKKMLAAARKDLGLVGRPNHITREYAKRNGSEYLAAPWCDMSVTYWARHSGNASAVLPKGDRAYTVAHAQDGKDLGRWHAGTVENIKRYAKPGAPIFFDWGGSNAIGAIDHIGVIEHVLPDGRVQTIEGNSGDACKRRVRSADVIAGFWNPDYSKQEDDVSAKDVWNQELPVPFGSKENPEWQAGNLLVNHGVWLRKAVTKVDTLTTMVAAQQDTIKELVTAVAQRSDTPVDVDALMARIETAIQGITVRLAVDPSDG
jgi:hypothetical protein